MRIKRILGTSVMCLLLTSLSITISGCGGGGDSSNDDGPSVTHCVVGESRLGNCALQ